MPGYTTMTRGLPEADKASRLADSGAGELASWPPRDMEAVLEAYQPFKWSRCVEGCGQQHLALQGMHGGGEEEKLGRPIEPWSFAKLWTAQ